jgi:hypothetical protein
MNAFVTCVYVSLYTVYVSLYTRFEVENTACLTVSHCKCLVRFLSFRMLVE